MALCAWQQQQQQQQQEGACCDQLGSWWACLVCSTQQRGCLFCHLWVCLCGSRSSSCAAAQVAFGDILQLQQHTHGSSHSVKPSLLCSCGAVCFHMWGLVLLACCNVPQISLGRRSLQLQLHAGSCTQSCGCVVCGGPISCRGLQVPMLSLGGQAPQCYDIPSICSTGKCWCREIDCCVSGVASSLTRVVPRWHRTVAPAGGGGCSTAQHRLSVRCNHCSVGGRVQLGA
jgi:hypothetical protein